MNNPLHAGAPLLQLEGVKVDFPQPGGRRVQVLKGIDPGSRAASRRP